MCDEIAIIADGALVARDRTTNLLGQIDARTMVIQPEEETGHVPEGVGLEVERRRDGTLAVTYHANKTSPEEVLDAVRAAGIRIADVRTEQADLEDVFLSLTRGAHSPAA
jgi:ABC-2 type transport system ATP-binding protein